MGNMPPDDRRSHLRLIRPPDADDHRPWNGGPMTATAAQIAAALRHTRPGLTPGRIHKLLYLCQGHHLAWYGQPLFTDPVTAWDNGVAVPALRGRELDGPAGYGGLPNGVLNTIGYVCSRYGGLHLHDLDILTRHSDPYAAADTGRRVGTTTPIDHDDMAAHFQTVDVDPDAPMIDAGWLEGFLTRSREQPARGGDDTPDDLDKLRTWAAGLAPEAANRSA